MSKPISWSQYWCYRNKPEEFYNSYILGVPFIASRPMNLGTVIHSGFEGKNWKEEMIKFELTEHEKTIEKLLEHKLPSVEKEPWLGEYGKVYEETNCCLAARADGIAENLIIEIKTSKNYWTQQRADELGQLTLYSFLQWKKTGIIPDCLLVSCNTGSGKVREFKTKRTEEQILLLCEDIKKMVEELKQKGWWEIRR